MEAAGTFCVPRPVLRGKCALDVGGADVEAESGIPEDRQVLRQRRG